MLDERQRRAFAAAEARAWGRGGVARVMRATGLARRTIVAGLRELQTYDAVVPHRGRRPGGGRKRLQDRDPTLVADLRRIVGAAGADAAPGPPDGVLPSSLRAIAAALAAGGHRISHASVARLMRSEGLASSGLPKSAQPGSLRVRRVVGPAAMRAVGHHGRSSPAPDDAHRPSTLAASASAIGSRGGRGECDRDRTFVAGLANGLAVIDVFDDRRPRLTIAEVASACGITRAAARRYLKTLAHLGYVEVHHGMYALTPKVIRLGQSFMLSSRLPQIIQPELLAVAGTLGEASSAGVLDGNDVISIAATTVGRRVSATVQPATRVPAFCTANGRVLIGAAAPPAIRTWIARQRLRPLTPFTVTDPEQLFDEIVRTRERGYAVVDQEFEVGLRTIAVPLVDHRGKTVAAINISAHVSRTTAKDLVERCLPALRDAQARLRAIL